MIAKEVIDFPDPDCPTTAKVLPCSKEKEILSTALKGDGPSKEIDKLWTSRQTDIIQK